MAQCVHAIMGHLVDGVVAAGYAVVVEQAARHIVAVVIDRRTIVVVRLEQARQRVSEYETT
jgi:hypothetical protein